MKSRQPAPERQVGVPDVNYFSPRKALEPLADAQLRAAGTGEQLVEVARARADAAEAIAGKNQATLDQAHLDLGYVEIRAPVAGIVSRKSVQAGQVVQAGQPLLALVPLERVWVVANFKESQLRRMRPGMSVVPTVLTR